MWIVGWIFIIFAGSTIHCFCWNQPRSVRDYEAVWSNVRKPRCINSWGGIPKINSPKPKISRNVAFCAASCRMLQFKNLAMKSSSARDEDSSPIIPVIEEDLGSSGKESWKDLDWDVLWNFVINCARFTAAIIQCPSIPESSSTGLPPALKCCGKQFPAIRLKRFAPKPSRPRTRHRGSRCCQTGDDNFHHGDVCG